jgi:hypothetical protein
MFNCIRLGDYALDGPGYAVLGAMTATFVIWRLVAHDPVARDGPARRSLLALSVAMAGVMFAVPTMFRWQPYNLMFRTGLEVSVLATGLMWIDILAWRRRRANALPVMRVRV